MTMGTLTNMHDNTANGNVTRKYKYVLFSVVLRDYSSSNKNRWKSVQDKTENENWKTEMNCKFFRSRRIFFSLMKSYLVKHLRSFDQNTDNLLSLPRTVQSNLFINNGEQGDRNKWRGPFQGNRLYKDIGLRLRDQIWTVRNREVSVRRGWTVVSTVKVLFVAKLNGSCNHQLLALWDYGPTGARRMVNYHLTARNRLSINN